MNKFQYVVGYGAGGHASIIIDIIKSQKKYKIYGLIDKKISKKKNIKNRNNRNRSRSQKNFKKKLTKFLLELLILKIQKKL